MRRLVLMSLLALCLAACGKDQGHAFLDTRTPPSLGPRFWAPEGWAWGTIEVKGAPEVRYGVSTPLPQRTDRHLIIATGYGESAEVYFEAARDLNARGWTVWVVEPHGQGGSGRFPGRSDVGRSAGFDKDAAAIRWLVENVVRPSQADTVHLAAHGSGALAALLALEGGLRRIDRLVLWSPDFKPPPRADTAETMRRFGLGGLRGYGSPWKRPTVNITRRSTLPLAWPVANPDLRMGGPGWSWLDAKAKAIAAALPPAELNRLSTPTRMRAGGKDGDARVVCGALPNCDYAQATAAEHLGPDGARQAWLTALIAR